jgi:hypothetical protein
VGSSVKLSVFVAMLAIAGGGYFYLARTSAPVADAPLTPEGKAYIDNLRLSDVGMQANDTYVGQTLVEVQGKIGNAGSRGLEQVEIYCVFSDSNGQLVLRKRLPIVRARTGGLKPGETKSFRLPFDDIPPSWNQAIPRLVIASVKFS